MTVPVETEAQSPIVPVQEMPQNQIDELDEFTKGLQYARGLVDAYASQGRNMMECEKMYHSLKIAMKFPDQIHKSYLDTTEVGNTMYVVVIVDPYNKEHVFVAESDKAAWQILASYAREEWSTACPSSPRPQRGEELVVDFFERQTSKYFYSVTETRVIRERKVPV